MFVGLSNKNTQFSTPMLVGFSRCLRFNPQLGGNHFTHLHNLHPCTLRSSRLENKNLIIYLSSRLEMHISIYIYSWSKTVVNFLASHVSLPWGTKKNYMPKSPKCVAQTLHPHVCWSNLSVFSWNPSGMALGSLGPSVWVPFCVPQKKMIHSYSHAM